MHFLTLLSWFRQKSFVEFLKMTILYEKTTIRLSFALFLTLGQHCIFIHKGCVLSFIDAKDKISFSVGGEQLRCTCNKNKRFHFLI